MKDEYLNNHQRTLKMKIYYEPDEKLIQKSIYISKLVENKTLSYFEYSMTESEEIDSLNFHNNLYEKDDRVYDGLSQAQKHILAKVPYIFDANFLNYTIGFRLKEDDIIGRSYYYYPVVWKEDKNRYGIRGITDTQIIKKYIENFNKEIITTASSSYIEVQKFGEIMQKFKGVSVTFTEKNDIEYKLYAKFEDKDIKDFIFGIIGEKADCDEFGEVALAAQRIRNNEVVGYNLYYLM